MPITEIRTHEQIHKDFIVNENDIVLTEGKFKGLKSWCIRFCDIISVGDSTIVHETGSDGENIFEVHKIAIMDEDIKEFPELKPWQWVKIYVHKDGTITPTLLKE